MLPDPNREKLSVPEIERGLVEIEDYLGFESSSIYSPLTPFKLACQIFEEQEQGLLGREAAYPTAPFKECVLFVAAAMDLVRYFRLVRQRTELRKLRSHFDLIGKGFFGVAGTYGVQLPNGSRLRELLAKYGIPPPTDAIAKDAARKSIELMFALAALNTFDGIEVEDPEASSKADPNPDLIIHDGSRRFGLACKSISSKHEETFCDNVRKGIEQIEWAIAADKVDARCGAVLLDVSALLEHHVLYPLESPKRWAFEEAGGIIQAAVGDSLRAIFGTNPPRTFHDILAPLFKGHDLPPGVLIYAHGLLLCERNGGTVPVYAKSLRMGFAGDMSSLDKLAKRLNLALHCQPAPA